MSIFCGLIWSKLVLCLLEWPFIFPSQQGYVWITDIPVPSATWCSLYSNWGDVHVVIFLEILLSEHTRNILTCRRHCMSVVVSLVLPREANSPPSTWKNLTWNTEIRPPFNLTISLFYQWLRQGVPKISGPPGVGRDLVTPQLTLCVAFHAAAVKGSLCLVPTAVLGKQDQEMDGLNRGICGRNPVTILAAVQRMKAWFSSLLGRVFSLYKRKKLKFWQNRGNFKSGVWSWRWSFSLAVTDEGCQKLGLFGGSFLPWADVTAVMCFVMNVWSKGLDAGGSGAVSIGVVRSSPCWEAGLVQCL